MAKITYEYKVALNENSQIPDVNKVNASDMNDIKATVNANDDKVGELSNLTTPTTSSIVGAINSVVSSGNNTNGNYVKYADGTMICYGGKSGDATWSDYWGFCKRSPDNVNNAIALTFPQTFTSTPTVQLTGAQDGSIIAVSVVATSTTTLKVVAFKPSNNSTTNYKFTWLAIGKWK